MDAVLRKRVTVASRYFMPCKEVRSIFSPVSVYKIPAVQRGGQTATLVIEDAYQSEYGGNGTTILQPVLAMKIAQDIVNCFTLGHGNCHIDEETGMQEQPAVWICAGDAPTAEEEAEYDKRQIGLAQRLVRDADVLYRDNKTNEITVEMKEAAKWMGLTDRLWIRSVDASSVTQCPACKEDIRVGALLCKHCGTDIQKFLLKLDAMVEQVTTKHPIPPPVKNPQHARPSA